MKNRYIPGKEDPPWERRFLEVNIATVGDSESELKEMYVLTNWKDDIITFHELAEILTIIKPFYDRTPDREIIKYNDENFKRRSRQEDTEAGDSQVSNEYPGFVYVLKCSPYYKIGISRNVDERIKQISTNLPFDLERICIIKTNDMLDLEGFLHEKFSSKRKRGEWFELDEMDIEYIMDLKGAFP